MCSFKENVLFHLTLELEMMIVLRIYFLRGSMLNVFGVGL
jgi:hypothetical protein